MTSARTALRISSYAPQAMGIDLVPQRERRGPGRGGEVLPRGGVENAPRGADDEPGPGGSLSVTHHLGDIAALRADAGHQERHLTDDPPDLGQLLRIGGADHQQAVAARVPAGRRQLRHDVIEPPAALADHQILQVARARVRGPAEHHDAAILAPQEGLERVASEVGIHRDGIGSVALEGLDGVALRGVADVAALGIENDRNAGVGAMNVFDGALELVFRLVRRVVGELRLVGADQVRRGVDDRLVELEDRRGLLGDLPGEALDLRIEARRRPASRCAPSSRRVVSGKWHHATRARSAARLRFFRWTSSSVTAAGVTPGTRPACPIVAGRYSARRLRTSCDSPGTWL